MTILEAVNAAKRETNFRDRVEFFLVKAAITATTESSGIPRHVGRVALAKIILDSTSNVLTSFALGIMTNPTVLSYTSHSDIPDNDIEFVVNAIYNSYIP